LLIGNREVIERLELNLSHMDHITIRSELRYLIGAQNIGFHCPIKNEAKT
jgi:hypothetical protein